MDGARDPEAEWRWRSNFYRMSAGFGLTSGVNVLIIAYSSSIAGKTFGFVGPAILYAWWILSSMLISSQVCVYLGSKKAMLAGVCLADTFYIAFTIAAALEDSMFKSILIVVGYSVSGIGAGLFWTAQGAYFARTSELLAEATGGKLEDHTQTMSSVFAALNFIPEVFLKLMASAIQFFNVPAWVSMGSACLASLVMTAYMFWAMETLPVGAPKMQTQRRSCGIFQLWRDPALWLLSFTNLTFGYAGALLNGKINGDLTKVQLGLQTVGLLMAMVSLVALAVQWPYERLVKTFGKVSVMWIGTVCFAAMACCALFLDLADLGWGLLAFYVLHGLGRAAYESTNRAIFADFWPPPASEDAFANVSMQQALAFTTAFLLQIPFDVTEMAGTLLVLALCIMPGYYLAHRTRAPAKAEEALMTELSLS